MYIDSTTGKTIPASTEQMKNRKSHIFWIAGIEAVWPPSVWVGPYNGELLFFPSKFENEHGGPGLNIPIGNVILTAIININPGKYEIRYLDAGENMAKEVDKIYTELISLGKL